MISKAAKTHWRLAYKSIKKALKVTLQDILQQFKARKHINKIYVDNLEQRKLWFTLEKNS